MNLKIEWGLAKTSFTFCIRNLQIKLTKNEQSKAGNPYHAISCDLV